MSARFSPANIAQIELGCTDLEEAKRFYCGSLGLKLVGEVGDSIFVKCGEVNLIVQKAETPRLGRHIYFNADGQIHEAARALAVEGILFSEAPKCIARHHQGHDVWLAFFEDPWGNPFALLANMPVAT